MAPWTLFLQFISKLYIKHDLINDFRHTLDESIPFSDQALPDPNLIGERQRLVRKVIIWKTGCFAKNNKLFHNVPLSPLTFNY